MKVIRNFKSILIAFALLELRTVYLVNDISLLRQIIKAARCFKYFKRSNKSNKLIKLTFLRYTPAPAPIPSTHTIFLDP